MEEQVESRRGAGKYGGCGISGSGEVIDGDVKGRIRDTFEVEKEHSVRKNIEYKTSEENVQL